jgi:L-amino acid N-acyltransferase YncA
VEVRRATFADIPEMLAMGKAAHAQSESAYLPFDEAGAKILGAQCMTSKTLCAFVAEHDGKIVGLVLGQEQEFPYLKAKFATDVAFYAQHPGAGRRLLRRFIEWARLERKVDQVVLCVSFGGKDSTSFFNRHGFRKTGGMFVMDCNEGKK